MAGETKLIQPRRVTHTRECVGAAVDVVVALSLREAHFLRASAVRYFLLYEPQW